MANEVEIVVIGAGVSGLATLKNLVDSGFTKVVLYEKTDKIGGLWQYREAKDLNGYGVMSFTHINVTKHNYCFSDFPFDEDVCDYPHHSQMAQYINSYCDHFKLRKYMRFNSLVCSLEKQEQGGWRLEVYDQIMDETSTFECKHVAVCSGHHRIPNQVSFNGMNSFQGEIFHSVTFKDAVKNRLQDKRVLVVGIGNSAVVS